MSSSSFPVRTVCGCRSPLCLTARCPTSFFARGILPSVGLDPTGRLILFAGSNAGIDEIAVISTFDAAITSDRLGDVAINYRPHPCGGAAATVRVWRQRSGAISWSTRPSGTISGRLPNVGVTHSIEELLALLASAPLSESGVEEAELFRQAATCLVRPFERPRRERIVARLADITETSRARGCRCARLPSFLAPGDGSASTAMVRQNSCMGSPS